MNDTRRPFKIAAAQIASVRGDVAANVAAIITAMRTQTFDGWHFTGHGSQAADADNGSQAGANADFAVMKLEAGEQMLPLSLSGLHGSLRQTQPLVFLNACHLGLSDKSFVGVADLTDT